MSSNQGSLAETKEILRSLVISSPQTVTIHELNRDFRNSEGYPIPYGKLGFSNLELFLRSLSDTLYVEGNGNVRALESSKSKHIDQMVAKQKTATRARKNGLEYRQNNFQTKQQATSNNYFQNNQRPPLYSHPPHLQQPQFGQVLVNQQMAYNYLSNAYGTNPMNAMHRIHQLQFPMMNLPAQLVNRNLLSRPTFFPQPLHNANQNRINVTNYQKRTELPKPNQNLNNNSINKSNVTREPEPIEISSQSTIEDDDEGTIEVVTPAEEEESQLTKSEEKQINEAMDRLKLGAKPKSNEIALAENNESDSALPELSEFDPIFQINTPSNVVLFGETIRRSELKSDHIKIGSKFPIFVTEIHNPTKFWLHLSDQSENFDNLMKDIAQFYSNNSDKELQIPTSNIHKGQVCAAQFLGIWHRGEIVSGLFDWTRVKVFFIDYGTTATMDIRHIKYLLKPFASMPAQIYRGALASIRPLNSHRWTRDSTYFLLSLVMDVVIQAKLVDIDYENQVMSLFLIDTNNIIDLHINNEMIIKGYAMAENQKWLSQANLTKTSIFYKIYPTFEMLEKGEYPSFYEIGIYLADGFDFYLYEDTTVIPGIDTLPRNVNKNINGVKSSLNPLSVSWYPRN